MTTRRDFLELAAGAGVGALLPAKPGTLGSLSTVLTPPAPAAPAAPAALAKFVDALPLPGDAVPSYVNGQPVYSISLSEFTQQLHRDLPPSRVWGYNGSFPGPTIRASRGVPITVWWQNNLPATHLLAPSIDQNLHGVMGNPEVRAVTHLHGGHVPDTSDGGPEAWYTSAGGNGPVGPFFAGDKYPYPNNQLGSTLWYHDHAMGITKLNVYAGLAGFYILSDPANEPAGLPNGPYEIPIVFQDRTFNPDGSLFYTPAPAVPEFFGDTMVVNGKVWPRLVVEARKYRFRFLNGCNSRFLRMRLIESDMNGVIPSGQAVPGPVFQQIGTDGGFLPAPVPVTPLLMAPGERCDVVIDFSRALGNGPQKPQRRAYFLLHNDAGTPFSNTASTRGAIPEVMLIEVKPATVPDTTPLPTSLATIPALIPAAASQVRHLTLDEIMVDKGLIALLDNKFFGAPASETPMLGTTEVWNIINLTPDTHPIHLHQTMFQILDRTPFDVRRYLTARGNGPTIDPSPYFIGPSILADPNERGWKDTVRANPGEVTRIIAPFEDYTGHYVWHCHILEHEDNEMMRPLVVGPLP